MTNGFNGSIDHVVVSIYFCTPDNNFFTLKLLLSVVTSSYENNTVFSCVCFMALDLNFKKANSKCQKAYTREKTIAAAEKAESSSRRGISGNVDLNNASTF